jgi:hypothetical protein
MLSLRKPLLALPASISKGIKPVSISTSTNTVTSAAKSKCPYCDTVKNATIYTTIQNATKQNRTTSAALTFSVKPKFEG